MRVAKAVFNMGKLKNLLSIAPKDAAVRLSANAVAVRSSFLTAHILINPATGAVGNKTENQGEVNSPGAARMVKKIMDGSNNWM